jgi:hypothetical protein
VSIEIQPPGPVGTLTGPGAVSLSSHGVAAAPLAGANITTIGAGAYQAGVRYQVDVYYYLNGTPASPADDDNLRLQVNNVTVAILPVNGAGAATGAPYRFTYSTAPLNGLNAIIVQAIGAATAGSIYHVTIVATPLGD